MTMNLSDTPGDNSMVSLNNNQSSNFVEPPDNMQFQDRPQNIASEKNMSENKQTMDSTPISDIMGQPEQLLEPPMMAVDPRMVQAQAQAPMMALQHHKQLHIPKKKRKHLLKIHLILLTTRCRRCLLLRVLRWRLVSQFKRN